MISLCTTVLAVVVADQATKLGLRGPAGARAGFRVVASRIWLSRFGWQVSRPAMWGLWLAGSIVLLIAGVSSPLSPLLVGLVVGGSLSQALESALRGSVTDYGRVGAGLVFNVADIALLLGATGLLAEVLLLAGSGGFG